jgi:hypothetical protein
MIKIRTQPHTEFAARHLVNQLAKLGKPAQIIDHIDPNSKDLHIIYNSHELHVLPKRWICMQTEIAQSHWFNAEYLTKIRKALAVWDYSEVNQQHYYHPRKSIVTPGYAPQPVKEKTIDYLFYGWIEGSERRKRILEELQKEIDIMVVTNTVGPPMWDILSRTKVVINIHYYENSPPEWYRFCECASFGARMVNEWQPNSMFCWNFKLASDVISLKNDFDTVFGWPEQYIDDNFEELKTAISFL